MQECKFGQSERENTAVAHFFSVFCMKGWGGSEGELLEEQNNAGMVNNYCLDRFATQGKVFKTWN